MGERVDSASRWIPAPPEAVYAAFVDRQAWLEWLPPGGMTTRIDRFEPWVDGVYRMTLTYPEADAGRGKTSAAEDRVEGRFVALVPGERVSQQVRFESDDPAFAGTMTMHWLIAPSDGGSRVTFRCEDVPAGISESDHRAGLEATLDNLVRYFSES